MMPYADPLRDFAAWFVQLWAESLGKARPDGTHVGPTPLAALGATDQHSQVQLFMEGPADKTITFIEVVGRTALGPIPHLYAGRPRPRVPRRSCVRRAARRRAARDGGSARAARTAEHDDLARRGGRVARGVAHLPLELATAYAGELYGVNAFDQPGVELGKQFTYAIMGRPGSDAARAEWDALPKPDPQRGECSGISRSRFDRHSHDTPRGHRWHSTTRQRQREYVGGSVTVENGRVTVGDARALAERSVRRARAHRPCSGPMRRRSSPAGSSGRSGRRWACGRRRSTSCTWRAGRGEVSGFTVPAINVRGASYDTARAIFRTAIALDAGAFILEIARSEIAYTEQRPAEYVTVMLGAALREGFRGPVFIQGDHFQVSAKKFAVDPVTEVNAVKQLALEAVHAGFYNIDIDTSTLVDLSYGSLDEQQRRNYETAAELTKYVREIEPEGVTISVGGEIGEVGTENSTPEELRAFMTGFNQVLAEMAPGVAGLSKISVQSGTSHGGIVLADGSIADVALDLETLRLLGEIARNEYGMSGAVQHGASTLPDSAFNAFPTTRDRGDPPRDELPEHAVRSSAGGAAAGDLRVAGHERRRRSARRRTRRAVLLQDAQEGARARSSERFWDLDAAAKARIAASYDAKFTFLFTQLAIGGTRGRRVAVRHDARAASPDADERPRRDRRRAGRCRPERLTTVVSADRSTPGARRQDARRALVVHLRGTARARRTRRQQRAERSDDERDGGAGARTPGR